MDFKTEIKDFFDWVDLDYYGFSTVARWILIIGGAVAGNFIKNHFFQYNEMWFSEAGINFGILNNICNFIARTLMDAVGFAIGALGGFIVYIIPAYVVAFFMYIFTHIDLKIPEKMNDREKD
jgi:hypothetical protein